MPTIADDDVRKWMRGPVVDMKDDASNGQQSPAPDLSSNIAKQRRFTVSSKQRISKVSCFCGCFIF
jgi:hypothetical protein